MEKDVISVMILKYVQISLSKNVIEVNIVHIDMFIKVVLILIWDFV
jgi:hypothetical protein